MPSAWAVRFSDALDLAAALGEPGRAPAPAVRTHDGTSLL
jgi:hypothetical protein